MGLGVNCCGGIAAGTDARSQIVGSKLDRRFGSRREHSTFSLKSPDFVPVAPRMAFSGMGQARIENNLFIYYS